MISPSVFTDSCSSAVCNQQKAPVGLLHKGGVMHFTSTTSQSKCAKCGRLRATRRDELHL
jgi:hypothetical protein